MDGANVGDSSLRIVPDEYATFEGAGIECISLMRCLLW